MSELNIKPAATVVVLSKNNGDDDVLLLHRNRSLSFFGGTWVFPGGKIEKSDFKNALTTRFIDAARVAAIRELMEETGLTIEGNGLTPLSLWTTPEGMPKRFKTWFFFTYIKSIKVVIDNNEITEYQWISPAKALEAHRKNHLPLSPPTYVTLSMLSEFKKSNLLSKGNTSLSPLIFTPKPLTTKKGICFLYEGDAGYEDEDIYRAGSRHRLWAVGGKWRYERAEWSEIKNV
jgi:8-oxo-dGTP pyrophosphatase MutT (NUDIX family)